MYSKYLDYTEAAVKANQLALAENEQKDILIGHLKTDLYQLRQIEGDYFKLNELILALQQKYSLLLDEKDRCEKEQRIKSEIDKNTILELKEEIDLIRVGIQKALLQIQDLVRENTLKKRMNDSRLQEVQAMTLEIKSLDNKNERIHDENKAMSSSLKGLKEERKRLEEECDKLSAQLDLNVSKLKALQKNVRNSQSINARLDKTLHLAESDNQKLLVELKSRNEDAKRAEGKLRSLQNQIKQIELSYNNALTETEKFKAEAGANAAALSNEAARGKEIAAKLAGLQASIRSEEQQLDHIINEEQKQRKIHFMSLDENKSLNGELDRLLGLISQFELINKELVDEIEIYSDQDEQAMSILNRRDQMREVVASNLRKVALTGDHIRQIKY